MHLKNSEILRAAAKEIKTGKGDGQDWSLEQCLSIIASGDYIPLAAGDFLRIHFAFFSSRPRVTDLLIALRILAQNVRGLQLVPRKVIGLGSTGGIRHGGPHANITSLASLVTASMSRNEAVAKFGNVGTREGGSSSFWESLLQMSAERCTAELASETIEQCGFGIVHAPTSYPLFAKIRAARQEARGPTIFNLIAPALNPILGQETRTLIGVYHPVFCTALVEACTRWAQERNITGQATLCFSGHIKEHQYLDEYLPWGTTECYSSTSPGDCSHDMLRAALRASNREMLAEIYEKRINHPGVQLLVANAAFFMTASDSQTTPDLTSVIEAAEAVRSGATADFIKRYVSLMRQTI